MSCLRSLETPVRIEGLVEHGFGRGSTSLGFPTANLDASSSESLSVFLKSSECTDGVYIGWATIDGEKEVYKAAVSVGVNPTFEDSRVRLLEAHLLDYSGPNFYGGKLRLILVAFIRESKKFDSLDELKKAIWDDCELARVWLEKTRNQLNDLGVSMFLHGKD